LYPSEAQKLLVNSESRKLVAGLGNPKPGEWVADNIKSLVETSKDTNKLANKDLATQRLEDAGKAAYEAIWWNTNGTIRDLVGVGGVTKLEELLPEPLKGLGEYVVQNLFENPEVLSILKGLDRKRALTARAGKSGDTLLLRKLRSRCRC